MQSAACRARLCPSIMRGREGHTREEVSHRCVVLETVTTVTLLRCGPAELIMWTLIHLGVIRRAVFIVKIQELEPIEFRLNRDSDLLLRFLSLNHISLLLVVRNFLLFLLDMIAYLQLVLNQVLSLGKGPYEPFSLLLAQLADLCLVHNRGQFELFLLKLKLLLALDELCSQDLFLQV